MSQLEEIIKAKDGQIAALRARVEELEFAIADDETYYQVLTDERERTLRIAKEAVAFKTRAEDAESRARTFEVREVEYLDTTRILAAQLEEALRALDCAEENMSSLLKNAVRIDGLDMRDTRTCLTGIRNVLNKNPALLALAEAREKVIEAARIIARRFMLADGSVTAHELAPAFDAYDEAIDAARKNLVEGA